MSIVIPAYNEGDTIETVLSEIQRLNLNTEVIVVDAGSVDGTSQIAEELGAKAVEIKAKIGIGEALRAGFDVAMRGRPDIVIVSDPDGQYPASIIPRLIEPIVIGRADVVLGSRIYRYKPPWNRLANKIFSFLVRLLTRVEVGDPSTGLRSYNKYAIETIFPMTKSKDAFIFPELAIKASNANLKTVEIPVTQRPRLVRYPHALNVKVLLKEVIRTWLKLMLHKLP